MTYKVNVVIEKDDFGYFAYVPDLKGCHTQGENLEEVMKNIKEAIELYVETLSKKERKQISSKEILTTSLEIAVG
jgi:predicted RNase H-like HicB family nuclease